MKVQTITSIKILAKLEYIPIIIELVGSISEKSGLESKQVKQLQLVVEETCLNVIEYAFDPDETGYYEVEIKRKPGKIVVSIEDQGLPFDFQKFQPNDNSGLGMLIMKAFADEIHFLNVGRQGNRVDIVKNLSYQNIEELVHKDEKKETGLQVRANLDIPLTFRLMKEDDSINVARCIYHSYGYSYGNDIVYYPEKMKEHLVHGFLQSCVVLNPENEIVGHLAMMLNKPDAVVGETGMAVVDPRFRGRGLFKKMKNFLIDYAGEREMKGIYSEAVAVHPFTQEGNISIGAHETGFLIGFTPTTMFFKKIQRKKRTKRQTTLLFYYLINDDIEREVYIPEQHSTIVESIIDFNNLKRKIKNKPDKPRKTHIKAIINVEIQTETRRAFLRIRSYGEDFIELVKFRLRELCLRRIDCIYIDLPLSEPECQFFCEPLEKFGFFFAGIIPEMYNGDVLRLQYLNNVEIDFDEIAVVSEFGKKLYKYVCNEYRKRAER